MRRFARGGDGGRHGRAELGSRGRHRRRRDRGRLLQPGQYPLDEPQVLNKHGFLVPLCARRGSAGDARSRAPRRRPHRRNRGRRNRRNRVPCRLGAARRARHRNLPKIHRGQHRLRSAFGGNRKGVPQPRFRRGKLRRRQVEGECPDFQKRRRSTSWRNTCA